MRLPCKPNSEYRLMDQAREVLRYYHLHPGLKTIKKVHITGLTLMLNFASRTAV